MFIRTERLFLRPCWPEDWRELAETIDERIVRNLASAPWPFTAQDARAFVEASHQRLLPRLLITLPSATGSRLIGACGLAMHEGDVELGFWIAADHWGRGYACEAGGALVTLAGSLGHCRLVSSHFVDNPASGRVLRKLGFRPSGRVVRRFSRGRGNDAPSTELIIDLCGGKDSDGGPDGAMIRRAA